MSARGRVGGVGGSCQRRLCLLTSAQLFLYHDQDERTRPDSIPISQAKVGLSLGLS